MAYIQKPVVFLNTQYGKVRVVFNRAKHVHVSTEDAAPILYRGKPYRLSLGLVSDDGKTWSIGDRTFHISITRQDKYGVDAPPSFRAAILKEMIEMVQAFCILDGDDATVKRAEYADANNDADKIAEQIREMNDKIITLQRDLSRARARMRLNEAASNA